MFFNLETKSFAWFSRSLIKVSKNKTNFAFLTTFTSYNKIIKSLDKMQKSLYQLYVFWPCWGSNKGNIQIIIVGDVVPWLTCYWCTFQWRIKLSDDICKCMEWSTISITLAFPFQYNFCFGVVFGDRQGQSVIKSMCCVDIHVLGVISWKTKGTVYLLFTRENQKFRVENQMVCIISFGKLQKIWAVIWGDAINLFF